MLINFWLFVNGKRQVGRIVAAEIETLVPKEITIKEISSYVFWKAHVITSIRTEEKKAREPNFWTIVKKNVMRRQQAGKRCYFKFILRIDFLNQY